MSDEPISVDMYDLQGNFIKHFKSLKDAGNHLGQTGDKISRVVKKERKSIEHRISKIKYTFKYCSCKNKK